MESIPQKGVGTAARFAREELEASLALALEVFPDRQLRRTMVDLVQGMIVTQSPLIARAMGARGERRRTGR